MRNRVTNHRVRLVTKENFADVVTAAAESGRVRTSLLERLSYWLGGFATWLPR